MAAWFKVYTFIDREKAALEYSDPSYVICVSVRFSSPFVILLIAIKSPVCEF
jgi:hypothetical protein